MGIIIITELDVNSGAFNVLECVQFYLLAIVSNILLKINYLFYNELFI